MLATTNKPELPVVYNFIHAGQVENLRDYVVNLANEGAEEGTLVIAENQSAAQGCKGKSWQGFPDNLHCAIILQPDFPVERYHELVYVAIVSLGNSIATHVAPMTALTYNWPNDINIASHKIAGVWLDHGSGPSSPWVAICCSVNIRQAPENLLVEAMSIHEADGGTSLTPELLLESWARQFVTQLNVWAERGFAHILTLWSIRADYKKKELDVSENNKYLRGTARDVSAQGDLLVDCVDGTTQAISIRAHMGW